jgi:FdhD protein
LTVPYRPQLSANARPATYTVDARDETGAVVPTPIAGEHPLTLYVDKREIVTLMTLGAAPEALAIGFLRNQRLVDAIEDIVAVNVDWEVNAVAVSTRNGLVDLDRKTEKRTATTGCGQGTVFGDLMEDIESIRLSDSIPCGCTSRSTSRRAPCTAARSRKAPRSSPSSRTSGATTRWTRSPDGCGSRA